MRRLVIDTNVYIDWLNGGEHEGVLFQREAIKYLSAIVQMELRAGAFSPADHRRLRRVEAAFEQAGRILAPSKAVFAEAGNVLRRLQVDRGYNLAAGHSNHPRRTDCAFSPIHRRDRRDPERERLSRHPVSPALPAFRCVVSSTPAETRPARHAT